MRSIVFAAGLLLSAACAATAAAEDTAAGRAVFEADCAKCHSLEAGATGFRGPHLAGLFARRYGAVEDFPYRMVWSEADPLWTPEHLDNYLNIHHLPEAERRAEVIEYLVEATGN